jgi:hypothetical protein
MNSAEAMNRRSRLLAVLFGAERPFGAFGAPGDADCRWRMLRAGNDSADCDPPAALTSSEEGRAARLARDEATQS